MPDYQNTKIYYLDVEGQKYYGHTTQSLSSRKSKHNSLSKKNVNQKVYKAVHDAGLDMIDIPIVLVENFPCQNVEEAKARERWWIDKGGELNNDLPLRTPQEWRKENLEAIKVKRKTKYTKNKQAILTKAKQYREKNKDEINKRARERYHHDDTKKKRQNEYRQQNKDKVREWKKASNERCKERIRNYEQNNKEAAKIRKQKWYNENKEVIKQKLAENPEKAEYFDLKRKEWQRKRVQCPLCGIELSQGWLKKHKDKQHPSSN